MALDATVKGTSSNSFATVVQANDYFADRLGADSWNSIGDEIMSLTGSASISGLYSSLDDQTEVTVTGVVALSPALSVGDQIQILTNVSGANGSHFVNLISVLMTW